MFEIKIIPYLNINNEYIKILTINPKPTGNLLSITKQISPNKLSPFKTNNNCTRQCIYAIMDFHDKNKFLCINQITELYNYLISNGYTINESFTKLMQKSNIDPNSQLLFFIN